LLQIINDVLDMSKIEAGKMPLDEEIIQVKGLLDSVRRLMIAKAEDNHIHLELICPENMPYLIGDERLIRQVFLNLLSNAVKFSKPNGIVTIKISYDELIKIEIIDHGIGIPKEQLNEVFEPFGQVSDPRVNKGQGTGLGLPIAKAMMDMHGGDLIISSEKDKGTTVTCIFPQTRVKNKS
jgi:signal transduction histidine kinase